MQLSCNPANDTRTVTVSATDDRGIAGVVLRWDPAGSESGVLTLTRVGTSSTWQGTLGPFAVARTVSYWAMATDSDGVSSSSAPASVAVDPCPG